MVKRYYSKYSLLDELQVDSKVASRLEIMNKKEMKKERNRVEKELHVATKLFLEEKISSRKKLKKDLHHI